MQTFDAETIHRLLPYEVLIPALQKMHEGEIPDGDGVYTKDPSGADNMFVTFEDQYYIYGEFLPVEEKGLTIGGFESAFLTDLVAAYILER